MSWKKIIVSGSDAQLNKLNVRTSITASGFNGDGSGLLNTGMYGGSGTVPPGTMINISSSIEYIYEATTLTALQLGADRVQFFSPDSNNTVTINDSIIEIATPASQLYFTPTTTYFTDNTAIPRGFQYGGNYRHTFTSRSFVDKNYVDTSRTGSYLNLRHTGSLDSSGSFKIRATKSMFTGSVNITGTLTAAVKSFSIPHQAEEGKQLVYGVTESPEHTVFVRGKLIDNTIITLPDEWEWLVDKNSITVQLTPINTHQQLFVDRIENNKIYVGTNTNHILRCYYLIYGERKDIPKLINIQ